MNANIIIRAIKKTDKNVVKQFLTDRWGAPEVVARGKINQADELPGFIAYLEDQMVGLTTYKVEDESCEIVSLDSIKEKMGIGTALVDAVKQIAKERSCNRVILITTNDNLHALGYYQRRGFVVSKIYPNALEQSRKIKPQIPLIGMDNIPLRDELELEFLLS